MGQLLQLKRDVYAILDAFNLPPITRKAHYDRNTFQPDTIDYLNLITALNSDGTYRYVQVSEAKSALHRFGDKNEDNSKWVSSLDGAEEYVYRYLGTASRGQFAQLTMDADDADADTFIVRDDRNVGTYNYTGEPVDPIRHFAFDIHPWILWGNSESDDANPSWTRETRLNELLKSLGLGAYSSVEGSISQILAAYINEPESRNASQLKVFGSGADDVFIGTDTVQRFVGRNGVDTVDYSAASGAVTVSLERPADQGQGFDGWARGDRFFGIENITGTESGDIIIGNSGENTLIGGGGRDIIAGRAGDDIIDGGGGRNEIYGNRGDDTIIVHENSTSVDGGQGFDEVVSAMSSRFYVKHNLYQNVEVFRLNDTNSYWQDPKVIVGSYQSETIVGNRWDNELYGLDSGDVLIGGAGNDSLEAGLGNDTYVFTDGWGFDAIDEEGGRDTLEFLDRNLSDLRVVRDIGVNSNALRILDKTSEDGVYVWSHFSKLTNRIEFLTAKDGTVDLRFGLEMEGTNGSDGIGGTIHDDYLRGKGGSDTLRGNSGDDFLEGGQGDDQLEGWEGNDTYVFRPGFGHDSISEAGRYPGEVDSPGDTIAFWGITQSQVRSYRDFQGRQHIEIIGNSGGVTDSIFIHSQKFNYGEGLLVEWMQFDGGDLIPIL
ncbi:MAG: calcium-binding protein [Aliishimia sp.]